MILHMERLKTSLISTASYIIEDNEIGPSVWKIS